MQDLTPQPPPDQSITLDVQRNATGGPVFIRDVSSGLSHDQWKSGSELLPYHPQASHVDPDYRDGWNACYYAMREAMEDAPKQSAGGREALAEECKRLAYLMAHQNAIAAIETRTVGVANDSTSKAYWTTRAELHAAIDRLASTPPLSAGREVLTDAARYRWLRANKHYALLIGDEGFGYSFAQVEHWTNERNETLVDAAVDAAMAGSPLSADGGAP